MLSENLDRSNSPVDSDFDSDLEPEFEFKSEQEPDSIVQQRKQDSLNRELSLLVDKLGNYSYHDYNYVPSARICEKIGLLLDDGAKVDAIIEPGSPCALLKFSKIKFSNSEHGDLYEKMLDKVDILELREIKDSDGKNLWNIAALQGLWCNMRALLNKGILPTDTDTDNVINGMICSFMTQEAFLKDRTNFLKVLKFLVQIPEFKPNSSNLITLLLYSQSMGLLFIEEALHILLGKLGRSDIFEALSSPKIQNHLSTSAENSPANNSIDIFRLFFKKYIFQIVAHPCSLFETMILKLATDTLDTKVSDELINLPMPIKEHMVASINNITSVKNIAEYLPEGLEKLQQLLINNIKFESKSQVSLALSNWGHFGAETKNEPPLKDPNITIPFHSIL